MKLTELDPQWLTPDIFIFKNPTGGSDWLSCSRVNVSSKELRIRFQKHNRDNNTKHTIVGIKKDTVWNFVGNDFATLTVTPSIDASASGNWHGFIRNGEIK